MRRNDSREDNPNLVIPDGASTEFRNLCNGFQRSAFSDQQEEIDSCMRRNDSREDNFNLVIPDGASAEFRNLCNGCQRSAFSDQ
jgi:hypothetical protein